MTRTRSHTHVHGAVRLAYVTRYSREWHAHVDTHDHDRTPHVSAPSKCKRGRDHVNIYFHTQPPFAAVHSRLYRVHCLKPERTLGELIRHLGSST